MIPRHTAASSPSRARSSDFRFGHPSAGMEKLSREVSVRDVAGGQECSSYEARAAMSLVLGLRRLDQLSLNAINGGRSTLAQVKARPSSRSVRDDSSRDRSPQLRHHVSARCAATRTGRSRPWAPCRPLRPDRGRLRADPHRHRLWHTRRCDAGSPRAGAVAPGPASDLGRDGARADPGAWL